MLVGNYIIIIIWAIYLILLLPLFLIKEYIGGSINAVKNKLILSLTFCFIGFVQVICQGGSFFSILIFLGLMFSLMGDYYLVYIKANEMKFIKGILFFGLAHIFYIMSMTTLEGIYLLDLGITVGFVLTGIAITYILKLDLGKLKIPLYIYFTLVTLMAVKAVLMVFRENTFINEQELFSLGALLFLISDLFLGVWRFVVSKKAFSYVVYLCYFIGQLMIATAAFYQ